MLDRNMGTSLVFVPRTHVQPKCQRECFTKPTTCVTPLARPGGRGVSAVDFLSRRADRSRQRPQGFSLNVDARNALTSLTASACVIHPVAPRSQECVRDHCERSLMS